MILTVGDSLGSEVFGIQDRRPDYLAFICTPGSRARIDEICKRCELQPSHFQVFEVPDDARRIDLLSRRCDEAYKWIRDKCQEAAEICFNPTAGRKWMSTGLSLYASRLDWPVLYVDAEYEAGKPKPGTEAIVELGNADDYAGMAKSDMGVELLNRLDFVGAAQVFEGISPSGSAAARELYRGLAAACRALSQWDAFEHYSGGAVADGLDQGLQSILRSAEELNLCIEEYVAAMTALSNRVREVEQGRKPSLAASADLFSNACRRIQIGRWDDGVARLYRALESAVQWILSLRQVDTSRIDWGAVTKEEEARFRGLCLIPDDEALPSELSLVRACRLANVLEIRWHLIPADLLNSFRQRHGIHDGDLLPGGLPLLLAVSTEDMFSVDWSGVDETRKSRHGENPPRELGLLDALAVDPSAVRRTPNTLFNQQGDFVLEKHLGTRNNSILAHGWSPARPDRANRFRDAVQRLLSQLGADLDGWDVPKLPRLWS